MCAAVNQHIFVVVVGHSGDGNFEYCSFNFGQSRVSFVLL